MAETAKQGAKQWEAAAGGEAERWIRAAANSSKECQTGEAGKESKGTRERRCRRKRDCVLLSVCKSSKLCNLKEKYFL
ncbi:uncharacterized protein DS421_14g466490 [Arachis hypogaea]|nr:uncharacterized protein DS421_14g466490 [Arachis hypogaea]